MDSIFSNYLDPLIEVGTIRLKPQKPSEIYCQLRIAYNQGVEGILENTRVVAFDPHDNEISDRILFTIWETPELQQLVRWINKNIVLNLGKAHYKTIDVNIRIATGMLNKISNNFIASPIICGYIFSNFIENIRNEQCLMNSEDLPFLG